MTVDQIKAFLRELQQNVELLLCSIKNAVTAYEIAEIGNEFGFNFLKMN